MQQNYPKDLVTQLFQNTWRKNTNSKTNSSESESENSSSRYNHIAPPHLAQNLESEIEIDIITLKEIRIRYRKSKNLKIHEVMRKYDDF